MRDDGKFFSVPCCISVLPFLVLSFLFEVHSSNLRCSARNLSASASVCDRTIWVWVAAAMSLGMAIPLMSSSFGTSTSLSASTKLLGLASELSHLCLMWSTMTGKVARVVGTIVGDGCRQSPVHCRSNDLHVEIDQPGA